MSGRIINSHGSLCNNCDYFRFKKYTNKYGSNWTCSDCLQAYWEEKRGMERRK